MKMRRFGLIALSLMLIANPVSAKVTLDGEDVKAVEINDTMFIELSALDKNAVIKENQGCVEFGGKLVPAIHRDGVVYIPARALGSGYSYIYLKGDTTITTSKKSNLPTDFVSVSYNSITNLIGKTVVAKIKTSYWDKNTKKIVSTEGAVALEPNATVKISEPLYIVSREVTYVNIIDEGVSYEQMPLDMSKYLGMLTEHFRLLTMDIEDIFPEFKTEYRVSSNGEIVKLISKSGSKCTVLHDNGTTSEVNSSSLSMCRTNRLDTSKVTDEQVIRFIEKMGYTSPTNYLVFTDLSRQYTHILKKSGNSWTVVKSLLSSSGLNATPTPTGQYHLTKKVPSFGQNKGYCCKNAVGFIGGTYLYHSTIFDKTGSYLLEGKGVLGHQASQGCVRFSPEEAEWFYKTLPLNSTVIIR